MENSRDCKTYTLETVAVVSIVGFLVFLAFFSGYELNSDYWAHYANSVKQIRQGELSTIILNLWDRPLFVVLYGSLAQSLFQIGQLISVALILFSALFIRYSQHSMIGSGAPVLPYTACLLLLLSHTTIFTLSYRTMTEVPVIFLISAGYFCLSRRMTIASLIFGLAPLARVETLIPLGCFLLLFTALEGIRAMLKSLSLFMTPFTIWYAWGIYYSRDALWMLSSNYASIRHFGIISLLSINALYCLPAYLSAPGLFLFLLGCFDSFRPAIPPEQRKLAKCLAASIVAYLCFISLAIVYPSAYFNGLGIAAVNLRSFAIIGPFFAFFQLRGLYSLWKDCALKPYCRNRSWLFLSVGVCVLLVLLNYNQGRQLFF